MFDFERTVGAPPDGFNPEGQKWGLPAPRWERIRADGFALLRKRIRHARELYDFIRVDHVVGLFRTFSFGLVPGAKGGFSPAAEPEQRAQGEAVLGAILEEAGATIVVAEDLGVIPPFVRASLSALGVPGYKVMRWEKINDGTPAEAFVPPAEYPETSLATTSTHDTDTLAEWWDAAPADERARMLALLMPAPAATRRCGKNRVRADARRDVGGAVCVAVADGDYPDSGSFWMARADQSPRHRRARELVVAFAARDRRPRP